MSFLSELKKQKDRLKGTETVVTRVDGVKFVEGSGTLLEPNTYGFVVDTKPDDIPVLIVDHLYIGSQDCAVKSVLEKFNINCVISLGIDVDVCNLEHRFVPVMDLPESDIVPVLAECLPFIRNCIEAKLNVLVHCNAGVSRTSMVAIAYLMEYEKMSFSEAYELVKTKRPAIQPNAGFKKQLQCLQPGNLLK
ncbi:probable dual specificity protein phosphatase DDB_G0283417 [Pararge aegeria]|uniref:Jg25434 protein n=2 Tax=Pararge aegeria TaxID=116150 RepID=A0A8S4RNM8_9NEOP|nr:probable dual specificity protein phosphatase DDB_G0283417 [Pararge aegeria]CAH2238341.1 jg25434 [Pararge aegeria aegeria]